VASVTPIARGRKRRGSGSRDETTAWIGMVLFLGSWAMLFAGLFLAYGLVRAHAPEWPALDQPRLPLLVPGLNTLVMLASSAALVQALRALALGRPSAPTWLAGATALGVVFLAVQLAVWARLWDQGLVPSGGPFPSVFYGLTVVHAAHVLVGVAALAWLTRRAVVDAAAARLPVRLWGMYWHFVGAVWLVLYGGVYVA